MMTGIILIGLQASGKSSFYRQNFNKTHIRINLDMLRTRSRERIIFTACLAAKQPVVIDNSNPTAVERRKYIKGFKENRFEIVGYYFSSQIEPCMLRNSRRNGNERVPEVGIKSTFHKLELPSYDEGFDQIFYVTTNDGHFNIESWKNEV